MRLGPRILIVEDEGLVAAHLNACLGRAGFEVVGTHDTGEEAVRSARELRPDLALMDIRLRGEMDGIQAAHELRRADVPVVFLTAYAEPSTVRKANAAEPFGYLVKPFQDRELIATVATAVRRGAAEGELKRRGRWFELVMGRIEEGVLVVGRDGTVVYMNRAAEALSGTTVAAAVGTPVERVLREAPPHGGVDRLIVRAMEGPDDDIVRRTTLFDAEGRRVDVHLHATALRPDGAEATAAVIVLRDARGDRAVREQALAEGVRVVAAGVAHDFNNLLTAILGRAELAMSDMPPYTEAASDLREVESLALDGAAIVRRLMEYAGLTALSRQVVDLADLVERVRAGVDVPDRIELEAHPDADLPPVIGDDGELGRAIGFLIANAVEAIGAGNRGRIVVRCGSVRVTADPEGHRVGSTLQTGVHAFVEVEDDGEGMSEETVARAFEPFFSTRFQGRGLGLAAVLGIVRRHEGAVEVRHAPKGGSVVRILLPPVPGG